MRYAFVLAAWLLSMGSVFAGPYKDIRDTAVYCSNGLTCDLTLKGLDDNSVLYSMVLSRASGPDTPLRLIIRTTSPLKEAGSLVFSADGVDVMTLDTGDFTMDSDNSEYASKDDALGYRLFGLLKDASALAVSYTADSGGKSRFSLAGISGAGLYLDEVQGRLDAADALVRVGPKATPPSLVRDILAFEQLPGVLRPDFESEDGGCAFYDKSRFKYGSGFAVDLGEGAELYVLPCSEGGAYNQPYAFYQIIDGKVSEVVLPAMSDEGPTTIFGATNVDWDQTSRMLTSFDKGRGLGDCGTWDRWKLRDSPGEASFVLLESRVKDECDGEGEGGPETWPLLWPKK